MSLSFLLELELLREMSHAEARAIVADAGLSNYDTPEDLIAFRRKYMRSNHPDKVPPEWRAAATDKIAKVNAAIDLLAGIDDRRRQEREAEKYGTRTPPPRRNYGGAGGGPDEMDRNIPKWAWAGYSGGLPPSYNIYREDYRDMNYFKKQMYILSKGDPDQQQYTIMAFDGHYFRSTVTVFASPKIYQEMAEAMYIWNSKGGNPYNTRAVFCYSKSNPRDLLLIYADDKYYDPPKHFEHESFNLNPDNDQHFLRRLPEMLDRLRDAD